MTDPQEACGGCGRAWEVNDVATCEPGGPWHHSDCDDPKLERTVPG